ncbi:hypothetical protein MTP99_009470 [Tenebrio molitor]|nr:hypothetical protein MTP99_009470 [Tenebrio molitor]
MRVCSRHFVEQDFITPSDWGYKKRYLKKNVIPSTNLPVSSIITKSINYKQEEKNKRIEWLIKRRQSNVNQLPGTSNVQQKSDNTFSDIDGAEVLLELARLYMILMIPDPTDKCAPLVGGISVHCVTRQAVLVDL